MYISLHVKQPLFLSVSNERLRFSTVPQKYPDIKVHKNPSSGSRVVSCGLTDRQNEVNSRFWKFCERVCVMLLYYALQPQAHCAILSQKFQLSPPGVSTRVTTREHPEEEGGTLCEKFQGILPKRRLPRYIQGYFTCRKGTTWNRRLYFSSEGRRAEDFFVLKIRRLRPGAKPRIWVPKDSTLPLDHRSRLNASKNRIEISTSFNPLNPELNPICYLLALLGAYHFLQVSSIRVKY